MRPAILVLAVTACSDLPPYQAECGNGVIDIHEDCDAPEGCLSCALPCAAGSGCPDGLVCGGDALCHAPGGRFRSEPQSVPFNASELFVADVDGDRVGDVIGVSPTALLVRRGVLYSGPGAETVTQTPFLTGPAAIGHFDGDASPDLVLPTAQSIVAYTSPQGALSPYPFALDAAHGSAVPVGVFPLDGTHIGALVLVPGMPSPTLHYATIDISLGMPVFENETAVCANVVATMVSRIEVHDAGTPSNAELLIAVSDGGEGCVFKVAGYASTELGHHAAGRLVFASISTSTACPSVLDGLVQYPATGSPGFCDYQRDTTNPDPLTLRSGTPLGQFAASQIVPATDEIAIGAVPLVPPISGYAAEALATNYGIYAIASNGAKRLYHADRRLDALTPLDIDNDGDLDVAATAAGLDDIDILYRFSPATPPAEDGFQLVRYDTVAYPKLMFAGDFDGNHIADLAYIERPADYDRLMVAYGTADRPLAPIEMAAFHSVVALLPGFLNQTDPSGTLGDLSVLDYDGRPLLTLLHGSPQRTLVPNFDPRPPMMPQDASAQPTFAAVAFGRFGGTGGPDGIRDLFSVITSGTQVTTYTSKAMGGAFQVVNDAPPANGFAVCGTGSASGDVCADRAHYLAWQASGGNDLLIAAEDDVGRVGTFDPASPTALTVTADSDGSNVAAGLKVHSLRRFDVDGDGRDELIAAWGADLRARTASPRGSVLACRVGDQGTFSSTDCPELGAAISDSDGEAVCVDASSGVVGEYQIGLGGTPPAEQLVIVCHRPSVGKSDVFAIAHDDKGLHARRLLRVPLTVERIFLGDVNGDAVADLLALDVDPQTLVPTLRVYLQCSSRDVDPECVP